MTKGLIQKIRVFEEKAGVGWMKEVEGLKTSEALKQKASEFDIELNDEIAEEALMLINEEDTDKLSDEELSELAGGKIFFH